MHIVVFGAGGVGGYFGARLVQGGEQVTFIARGDHLQAMRTQGLRVDSTKGNFQIRTVTATDDTTQVKGVDAILLCVKTWQIPEALQAIPPMLGRDTFIVPIENGVEAPAQLADALGSQRVLGGLCSIFSQLVAPGYIQHTGAEPFIALGELDNCPTERAENFLQALENSGIEAEMPSDITLALWQKFLLVAALSGVGAITRVPIGAYRTKKGLRQMFESVAQECYDVGIAQGVELPPDSVGKVMQSLDLIPADTIASMQRDFINGCPTEIEAQNGAVVRMGQKLNIPTPVNSFLYNCLLPQDNSARGIKN